jgi:tellurite resistance protein TerA
MTDLAMGANTGLASGRGEVVITHAQDPGIDVNLTAFLVGADGKVRSDADMVFFNQPAGEGGSATYHPPAVQGATVKHRLGFDLGRLPAGVEKIVVTLTEDAGPGFAKVGGMQAEVEGIRLAPVPSFTSEKGIMVAEVYVRNGQNKVRAVWQGYSSGLAGLATAHGVEVDDEPAAPPPISTAKAEPSKPAEPAVSFKKVSGNVNLKKGDKPVLMEKTQLITASVTWRSGTDYDVYALVMTKDGKQVDVATFGAEGVAPRTVYGRDAVKHLGDIVGGGKEIIEIRLNPDIIAVVPVAYSAQSNGTGSFYRYKVALNIDNGRGTNIEISSENANNDDHVYTCVPGIIRNTPDGVVVDPLEIYSKRSSENRPKLELQPDGNVTVRMDAGPRNDYK